MSQQAEPERTVVVHTAGTWTEAVVIRGLLESAGITVLNAVSTDPFPMREPPKGPHGTEILVLKSQTEEARRLIEDYLAGNKGPELEEPEESSQS
jgi:hypothetical protein